jgi:hypothetical protein
MKIPERMRIGFIDYDISYFKERSGGMGLGQCNGKEATIEIAEGIPERIMFKVFIHECLHAIIEQYGVNIPEDNNEEIVRQLETGVAELVEQMIGANNVGTKQKS